MTYTVTQDFREEYEHERTQWLRRRTLLYTALVAGFGVFELPLLLMAWMTGMAPMLSSADVLIAVLTRVPQIIVYSIGFFYVWRTPLRQHSLLRVVSLIIIVSGVIALIAKPLITTMNLDGGDGATSTAATDVLWSIRRTGLSDVFVLHFVACLFIPWSPRESLRPLIPLLGVLAVVTLIVPGGAWTGRLGFVLLSPMAAIPGVLVCLWRHSRFRNRFHYRMFRRRYGELQRELIDARTVHEGLFPKPVLDGPVRFHYRYEPMRQIGGDYLYVNVDAATPQSPNLNMVLIDVTGHGIKAALTINRIYGELERVHAETPDIRPGELLLALNRYVRLTLAKHSIFATALCLRVIPSDDLIIFASAGHPPAFLISAAGRMERLDSTAPLLGVIPKPAYDPGEISMRFGPGDTLIAYTDGATDSMNGQGKRLQINGLMRMIASVQPEPEERGRFAASIAHEINQFRANVPVDDTLLVEVWRPVGSGTGE